MVCNDTEAFDVKDLLDPSESRQLHATSSILKGENDHFAKANLQVLLSDTSDALHFWPKKQLEIPSPKTAPKTNPDLVNPPTSRSLCTLEYLS